MSLLGVKIYKDLECEIEIVKSRLEYFAEQKKMLLKQLRGPKDIAAVDYSKDKSTRYTLRPLEDVIYELQLIENQERIENEILNNMYKTIEKVQENLQRCTGLEYKVAYMKEVEGKKLAEIAEKLGYSEQYIKEVSSRIKTTY